MSLLIGAFTIGLILSLLALGVYISFRVFEFADITADGSITFGAAVAATMLIARRASRARQRRRFAAGRGRRSHCTGVLHTRFRHQQAAVRHPGDDRALLDQPARHGAEQRAAALRSGRSRRYAREPRALDRPAHDSANAARLAGERARRLGRSLLALRRAAIAGRGDPVLFFRTQPRQRHARLRRQRADDPRARRQRREHDRPRPGALERPGGVRRRAAGAVPGLRGRADGHRHGGVGTGQRHHRRGAGRDATASAPR